MSLPLCNRHVPVSVVRRRDAVIGAVPGYMGRSSGVGVCVFSLCICPVLLVFTVFHCFRLFYFHQGYPGGQNRIKGWHCETSKPFPLSLVYICMCLFISGQMNRWLDGAVKDKTRARYCAQSCVLPAYGMQLVFNIMQAYLNSPAMGECVKGV